MRLTIWLAIVFFLSFVVELTSVQLESISLSFMFLYVIAGIICAIQDAKEMME